MSRLTQASLTHRTVALLLSLLVIGLGVYTAGALKQELIPNIDIPRATVVSAYIGATPEIVERDVTTPIEDAVRGVSGVTTVTSKSTSGMSQVRVEWDYGNDANQIQQDIRNAIDSASSSLPTDVSPMVVAGSFDDIPIVVIAASSTGSQETLGQQIRDVVIPQLKTVPGVRDVTLSGERTKQVVVTTRQKDLDSYGVDVSMLPSAFAANGIGIPAGTVHTGTENLDVQVGTSFSSLDAIRTMRVQGTDGPVELQEFASVKELPVEQTSIARANGKESLTLIVTKQESGNTVAVAAGVAQALPGLARQLGDGTTFDTVFDQAPYIEQSVHDLTVEGGLGLVMAVLVIMLFLWSLTPTIITAISIPLSLFIALIGLWSGGYTLNIITLGALTVAIGRVVDDSIVVIENIKRHAGLGEYGPKAIVTAVRDVAGAVTSSTLTTVAVFLPIAFVGGQAGVMFRPFAVTVTVALVASLLVSLTVVPVLASWFIRPPKGSADRPPIDEHDEPPTWLQRLYLPVLNWTLAHRLLTLVLALVIFAGTMMLTPRLKTDFIGEAGQTSLVVSQDLPAGTSLQETDAAAKQIEALIAAEPTVLSYSTSVGSNGGASLALGGATDVNHASHSITLKPKSDGNAVAAHLREGIAALTGAGVTEVFVGRSSSDMIIYVESPDQTKLAAANQQVLDLMHSIPNLSNIKSDLTEAKSMLSVDVDEQAAADAGMTQGSIGQAVTRAVRGQKVGSLRAGETTLDVVLRSQKPVTDITQLRQLPLPITTKQTMDARTRAADKVTDDSDVFSAKQKADGYASYADGLKAIRDSRAKAVKQLSSLQATLKKLIAALSQPLPTTPPDPYAGIKQQIASVQAGITAAKAQIKALDSQYDKTVDSYAKAQRTQDQSKALQEAGKDAAKAKAKAKLLHQVADVHEVQAPATISHVAGNRTATVSASPSGSDLGATTTAIQTGLADLKLPAGVTVRIGGVSQQQQESFAQLGLAMLVAIAVVYLIMVATFGSLLQPLILLVSIPFAATGAVGLSLLTDTPLGIPSMIGLLMLIGIVVTNAIVLIDLINQYRRRGAPLEDAIQHGARLRLRPIVMTAMATIMALVPMGLGVTGGGVFISKPLAIVVIGGLVSSTLLTLILVPVLYDLVERFRSRKERRAAKAAAKAAGASADEGASSADGSEGGAVQAPAAAAPTGPATTD